MHMHKNARLTPQGRYLLVQLITKHRWTVGAAARAGGLSEQQAYRLAGAPPRRWGDGAGRSEFGAAVLSTQDAGRARG
jgi:hypothetical protein